MLTAQRPVEKIAEECPDQEYWENELEVPYQHVERECERPGFMDDWIAHRSGLQVERILGGLGLKPKESTRRAKQNLSKEPERLFPYVLIQEFAKFKLKSAVVEYATTCLAADVM